MYVTMENLANFVCIWCYGSASVCLFVHHITFTFTNSSYFAGHHNTEKKSESICVLTPTICFVLFHWTVFEVPKSNEIGHLTDVTGVGILLTFVWIRLARTNGITMKIVNFLRWCQRPLQWIIWITLELADFALELVIFRQSYFLLKLWWI